MSVSAIRLSVTFRPRCMTTIRSQTAKTSGSVWVMRMTGTPWSRSLRMISSTFCCSGTPRLLVGSSMIISFASQ